MTRLWKTQFVICFLASLYRSESVLNNGAASTFHLKKTARIAYQGYTDSYRTGHAIFHYTYRMVIIYKGRYIAAFKVVDYDMPIIERRKA